MCLRQHIGARIHSIGFHIGHLLEQMFQQDARPASDVQYARSASQSRLHATQRGNIDYRQRFGERSPGIRAVVSCPPSRVILAHVCLSGQMYA